MYEAGNNAVEGRQNFIVDGLQERYTVGVFHTETAGLIATNYAGAPQSRVSKKRVDNHGKRLQTQGGRLSCAEAGWAAFKI